MEGLPRVFCDDSRRLRRNVRHQLPLQHEDLVLQHQLAFLQALELKLVMQGILLQGLDGAVEVTMFQVEFADAPLDLFGTFHCGGHGCDYLRRIWMTVLWFWTVWLVRGSPRAPPCGGRAKGVQFRIPKGPWSP